MVNEKKMKQFVLCIESKDCEDLEKRKIYQVIPDESAAQDGYLRIIDESGEDYLYPESYFVFIQLPQKAQKALLEAWLKCPTRHLRGTATTGRSEEFLSQSNTGCWKGLLRNRRPSNLRPAATLKAYEIV